MFDKINKAVSIISIVLLVIIFGVLFYYKLLLAGKDVENFYIKNIKFNKSFIVLESLPEYSSRTFEINIGNIETIEKDKESVLKLTLSNKKEIFVSFDTKETMLNFNEKLKELIKYQFPRLVINYK